MPTESLSFSPHSSGVRTVVPSITYGSQSPELWEKPLSALIYESMSRFPDREAVVVPWQSRRLTYQHLADRSALVAKALLGLGLKHGDCVGIMAGNCYEYIEIFLGGARIGCPVTVLNNTFSPELTIQTLSKVNCKILFLAGYIGTRSLEGHFEALRRPATSPACIRHLISLGKISETLIRQGVHGYNSFLRDGDNICMDSAALEKAERMVVCSDVLNFQFTSGTTGLPKAAALTHRNLINDGIFVGRAMRLTEKDVVCCPPPLFHCFGLVMGFLASFYHGSTIVFPSDNFNVEMTLDAVEREGATALLGVPTMFLAELDLMKETGRRISRVRTGLAAGSPVAASLMEKIRKEMNIDGMLIAYGMTETSPVTFITSLDDSTEKMFNTVGKILPHSAAKVIDSTGAIVPLGSRGEICTSGFALQKGYWDDEAKTKEAMRMDEGGVLWMHTGDEGYIDEEGYGYITGRIKDLIIRGGENISPGEIEDRLLEHRFISEACVVGLEDRKYGEVVAAFLKPTKDSTTKLTDKTVRSWVSQTLGRVKEPQHIFWLGESGVWPEYPKTGSGKYQKHLVRHLGNDLIKKRSRSDRARL